VSELEQENERLERDCEKFQQKYKNEVASVEKENDQLKRYLEETGDKAKISIEKLKNLEIDNEAYER
jgi:formylmethanofuran dehydrogenase subunit D